MASDACSFERIVDTHSPSPPYYHILHISRMTFTEENHHQTLSKDSNDPILEECPVFWSTVQTPNLYLLNLPSRYASYMLSCQKNIKGDFLDAKARFKPKCGLFELSLPMDTQHSTLKHLADDKNSSSVIQKMVGANVPCTGATYAIARMTFSALHLTPVTGVIDMHVDQSHLDEADRQARLYQKQVNDSKDAADDTGPNSDDNELINHEKPIKQIAVQVRKRETEEQVNARLTSYAYLKKVQEDEPWKDLSLIYSEYSAQSKHLLDGHQEEITSKEELTINHHLSSFDSVKVVKESSARDYLMRLTGQVNK